MNSQDAPSLSGGNDFPLILGAAFSHPDTALRERLLVVIGDWIEAGQPRHSAEAVSVHLTSYTGTPLEPFFLSDKRLKAAVCMARIAFSERFGQHRLRIVSQETLGSDGGVVLTDNLQGYYVERYAYGQNRNLSEKTWFIASAEMERSMVGNGHRVPEASVFSSTCRISDSGYLLEIPVNHQGSWSKITAVPANLVAALQAHSFVLDTRTPLSKIGIRIEYHAPHLLVQTGSPESLMRVSALMAQHATLVFNGGPDYQEMGRLYVALDLPQEERTNLKSTITVTQTSPALSSWIGMEVEESPSLSSADKLRIARWIPPHENWMTQEFLDGL